MENTIRQNNVRFKTVDIIKGIAMIMVILVHYNQNYSPDIPLLRYFQMGCPMFFVASGFGIATLISKKYDNKNSKKDFYISRIKSIAPAWYFALVFIYLVNTICIFVFNRQLTSFSTNRNLLSIIINLLFLHGLVPSANNTVMPGGWYIGTTAILYFLSPYIFNMIKKGKNRIKTFIISSFISVSLLVLMRIFFEDAFNYNGFGYFSFLNHYPAYCLGMMLYFDYKERVLNRKEQMFCMYSGIILIAIAILLFLTDIIPYGSFLSSWATALSTYLFIYAGISFESTNKYKSKILDKVSTVGKKSYCIYLFHAFFAYTFVTIFRKIMNYLFSIDTNNYMWHIILAPMVIIMACVFGVQIEKLIKTLSKKINKAIKN